MTTDIRPANPSDAASIALLGRITFTETFGLLFKDRARDLRDYLDATFGVAKIERSLAKPENAWWLAFRDRLPVGYAKLKFPSPPGQDAAQLQKIYVLHEFLDAGIGRDLLLPVMQYATARASVLWLDVLRENARAIRFYERFGFGISGEDTFRIGAQSFLFHRMSRSVA